MTHFGAHADAESHLARVRAALEEQARWAQTLDAREFAQRLRRLVAPTVDTDTAAAYEQALPPEQSHAGLLRFLSRPATLDSGASDP